MKINIKIIGFILLIVVSLFSGYLINLYYGAKDETRIDKQNIKALKDTLRVTKNKIGELEYSKATLISDKDDLSGLNKELSEELKKAKGKISELSKYSITVNPTKDAPIKSTKDTLIKKDDEEHKITWNFDKKYNEFNWLKLSGETNFIIDEKGNVIPLGSNLLTLEERINITQGLREKDGLLEVFIKSDHPFFNVNDLESVIINPKDHVLNSVIKEKAKRFGLGPVIGYGFTQNGTTYFIGAGLTYSIIRF